jgi:glycosyltransferase involved in cell wall biosynthesis
MKILFFSHQADFIYGGEICTLEIMRELKKRHEIVFASPEGPYQERAKAVAQKVITVPSQEFSRRLAILPRLLPAWLATKERLETIITDEKPDLIHATSLKAFVYCLSVRGKIPIVWHHHDIMPGNYFNQLWLRALSKMATKIIVPSSATKAALVQAKVESERIEVVFNGFSPERWTRRLPSKSGEKFTIALIGEISHRKGSDLIFPIVNELKKKTTDFCVWVIGEGLSDPSVAHTVREENAAFVNAGLVEFLGRREDIPALLQKIDVLMVPSRQDPLPTVIVEAYFSGVPVLGSDAGWIPEMIAERDTGYLCRNLDDYVKRILELKNNAEIWRRFSENSRSFAERKFSIRTTAEKLEKIYLSLPKA